MTFISELKQAVSAKQWRELLKQLFENENTRTLRRELQLSEGMLEQMMSEMEASRYTYELGKYEKVLRLDLSSPPLLQSQYAVPFAGQLAFGKLFSALLKRIESCRSVSSAR